MEISNTDYKKLSLNFNGTKQITKIVSEKLLMPEEKIYGQNSCWKLYKPEVLEQFIKSDNELSDILSETMELSRAYGLKLSIAMLQKFKTMKPEINKFYEILKSKYDIDLNIPPKVYRFVGKAEIETLKNNGIVKPQRGYWDKFDVTINPNLNWNDCRITFKPDSKFSIIDNTSKIKENIGNGHDYFYLYEGPYTIDDVESIEETAKNKNLI